MNHDGRFGNFFSDLSRFAGVSARPDSNEGATVSQRSFEGSPVLDDYSVLSRWWQQRLGEGRAQREVLYYNTISLHDGNQLVGAPSSPESFRFAPRAKKLFADLGHFMADIRASHRHAIVVLVAEHGAAVGGEPHQMPGLREIPSPAITRGPVAVAFIGDTPRGEVAPRIVDSRTSFLALATLLSRVTANNPFDEGASIPVEDLVADLPTTRSVAENAGTVVMESGSTYFVRRFGDSWKSWGR